MDKSILSLRKYGFLGVVLGLTTINLAIYSPVRNFRTPRGRGSEAIRESAVGYRENPEGFNSPPVPGGEF
jgi:hypothetical protein